MNDEIYSDQFEGILPVSVVWVCGLFMLVRHPNCVDLIHDFTAVTATAELHWKDMSFTTMWLTVLTVDLCDVVWFEARETQSILESNSDGRAFAKDLT